MRQAVGVDVASCVVVIAASVNFTEGNDGVDVDVSDVQYGLSEVDVVVAGVDVGAEDGTYFYPSSWMAKKVSNIFAQRSVTSCMSSVELTTSDDTLDASVENKLGVI